MEALTDKQLYARAYYAKNAEKIKAQKRDSYNNTVNRIVTPKSKSPLPKARISPKHTNAAEVKKEHIPAYEDRKTSARERLENIRIEKEIMGFNL
jgi:hypothetical protein